MTNQRKLTVIGLFVACLSLIAGTVFGGVAATVTHLSGSLAVLKADGVVRSVSIGSNIDEGDTVISEKRTYARLKFNDGGEVTLKPDSKLKIETYSYDQGKPKEDTASLSLIKGGLRTITGQIGKRGNQESYQLKTPTATIGVRGTIYDTQYCAGGFCGAIKLGLYLEVLDGSVVITNSEGIRTTLRIEAGQYAYIENSTTPPVVLPTKPNIPFDPPPSFGSTAKKAQPAGEQNSPPSVGSAAKKDQPAGEQKSPLSKGDDSVDEQKSLPSKGDNSAGEHKLQQTEKKTPGTPNVEALLESLKHDPAIAAKAAGANEEKLHKIQNRLKGDPEVTAIILSLMKNPEALKLLDDPEVMRAINNKDIKALSSDPRFSKLIDKGKLREILKRAKDDEKGGGESGKHK